MDIVVKISTTFDEPVGNATHGYVALLNTIVEAMKTSKVAKVVLIQDLVQKYSPKSATYMEDLLTWLGEVQSVEFVPAAEDKIFHAAAGEVERSLTLGEEMRLRAQIHVDSRFPFLRIKSGWLDRDTCALYVGGTIGGVPQWFTVILTPAEVEDILEKDSN